MTPSAIDRSQLRHFGWLLALALAIAGARLAPSPSALTLELLAAAAFALGTVWPSSMRWPFAVLTLVTAPVGWVVSRALLTLVYYGVVTPLALLLRLFGRDALHCRLDPNAATYWRSRPPMPERRRYLRQF